METQIFIIIGTKGQLIKMAPIIKEIEHRKINFILIDAKQHTKTLSKQIKILQIKKPDISLKGYKHDINNSKELVRWLITNTFLILKIIRKFSKKRKIVIIHGDAPPVILGVILKIIYRDIILLHIEAGERTYNNFQPFPEEIIRKIADKLSDIRFASSIKALRNLEKEGLKKNTIYIYENTLIDAVNYYSKVTTGQLKDQYVLCSIHRYETITNIDKLKFIVETITEISKHNYIIFPMHESTKWYLKKTGLYESLKNNDKIIVTELMEYPIFLGLIKNSKFIITDGGGPQQEATFLGVPCLVMRELTERNEEKNIFLAKFSKKRVEYFLNNLTKFKINPKNINKKPTKIVVDVLEKLIRKLEEHE